MFRNQNYCYLQNGSDIVKNKFTNGLLIEFYIRKMLQVFLEQLHHEILSCFGNDGLILNHHIFNCNHIK